MESTTRRPRPNFFNSRNASLVGGGDTRTMSAMVEGKHISLHCGNSAEHSRKKVERSSRLFRRRGKSHKSTGSGSPKIAAMAFPKSPGSRLLAVVISPVPFCSLSSCGGCTSVAISISTPLPSRKSLWYNSRCCEQSALLRFGRYNTGSLLGGHR